MTKIFGEGKVDQVTISVEAGGTDLNKLDGIKEFGDGTGKDDNATLFGGQVGYKHLQQIAVSNFFGTVGLNLEFLAGGRAVTYYSEPVTATDCGFLGNGGDCDAVQSKNKGNSNQTQFNGEVEVGAAYQKDRFSIFADAGLVVGTYPDGRSPLVGIDQNGNPIYHDGQDYLRGRSGFTLGAGASYAVSDRLSLTFYVERERFRFDANNSGLDDTTLRTRGGGGSTTGTAGVTILLGKVDGPPPPPPTPTPPPRSEAQGALDRYNADFLSKYPGVEESCGPLDPVLKSTPDFDAATGPQDFPRLDTILPGVSGWYYSLGEGVLNLGATDRAATYDDVLECYEDAKAKVGAAATAAEPAPATAAARGGDTGSVEGDVAAARAAGVPIQEIEF